MRFEKNFDDKLILQILRESSRTPPDPSLGPSSSWHHAQPDRCPLERRLLALLVVLQMTSLAFRIPNTEKKIKNLKEKIKKKNRNFDGKFH